MFLFGAEAKLSVSRYLVCSLLIVCMCGTKNILFHSHNTIFKQGWCPISYVFLRKKRKERSRALAHSPFYPPAKITTSQAGTHSGDEPEAPAPDPKLVSLLSTDCM